eukprot:gene14190-15670_t
MEIDKHMEPTANERRPSSMLVTTGFGQERERFEKEQTECISKAIKSEECAAKEKHIRRTIIGTWQERGSATFWNILGKMPLPSQNIMCWKAMMVFHKILREGHTNCMKDSYVFRRTLKDLYSVYKFSTSLYGQLVTHYLRVLQCKLEFHHRYPKIPGSLVFTDDNPFRMPHRDINDVFHFAVEVLDYQDLLLKLEEEAQYPTYHAQITTFAFIVMKTIDKSKSSSQLHTVQCRIAPLVPLLKECSGIYDIIRYVMIKLHKSLPPDTLSGHRERFNQQFARIKQFTQDADCFAYIKALTSIPKLPDVPPNFLVYTMEQPKPKPKVVEEKPNTPILPQKDDRDFLIEQLMREINELQDHLESLERDAVSMRNAMKAQLMQLKEEASQYKRIAQQACDENAFLKSQLEGFTNVTKEDDEAKEKANEMFNKLKQKYTILRNEHVAMIRQNAELKRTSEQAEQKKSEIESSLGEWEQTVQAKEDEIKAIKENLSQLENINSNTHDALELVEKEKNVAIHGLNTELESMKEKLAESEHKKSALEMDLEKVKSQFENQLIVLQAQLEHMTSSKLTQEDARKSTEEALSKIKSDKETLRTELETENSLLKASLEMQRTATEGAESQVKELKQQLQDQITELSNRLTKVQLEKLEQEQARQASESAIEALKSSTTGELSVLAKSLQESVKEKNELLSKKEEMTTEIAMLRSKAEQQNIEMSKQIVNYQSQVAMEASSKEAVSKELHYLRTETQSKIENLSREMETLNLVKSNEEAAKRDLERRLENERIEKEKQLSEQERLKREGDLSLKYSLIEKTVEQCQQILQETLSQFDDHLHTSGTTCTAGYLKTRLTSVPPLVDHATSSYLDFKTNENDVTSVLNNLMSMTHSLSESLLYGKSTSHMASHEDSEDMIRRCKIAATSATAYLSTVKERSSGHSQVNQTSADLKYKISDIINAATLLIPKETDNLEGVGDMVDEEINNTAQMVADASARIEEMLRKSRQQHTGVQLEVNERILDSCNDLMKAIRELIMKSKDLQEEIVIEGKGTASAKEFYKRHHKWTEGLLSAAKSVGMGASILVDAADKVVERKGKFEELMVASNEIAASTAQLVAASRVKASKGSEKLSRLMRASKNVGQSTAKVVATVKSGAEMTEDASSDWSYYIFDNEIPTCFVETVPDYSKLSLTQAKRFEMESQVRMLELESDLGKEREKLGRLRKAHYQIAAELGLIDESASCQEDQNLN